MGQYYRPIVLKRNWKESKLPVRASIECYVFDNGAKLMEHSYVGNDYVNAAMVMIDRFDRGTGVPFAWAGDYADPTHGDDTLYDFACRYEDSVAGKRFAGSIRKDITGETKSQFRYIINRTKKEYAEVPDKVAGKLTVHPLPILTADGNGRGGGDYCETDHKTHAAKHNAQFVGAWKFDRISVSNDGNDVEGYARIDWETETEE